MKTIVLTGGPCAGKTSVMNTLKVELDRKARFVGEAAADVLKWHGLPQPGWVEGDWLELQRRITRVQAHSEQAAKVGAALDATFLVVCDRGVFDNLAYRQGHEALTEAGVRNQLDRYDLVIHLESLAVADPRRYEELARGNASRYESLAEALAQEQQTLDAWSWHPNRVVLTGRLPIDELSCEVLRLVLAEMEVAA